MTEHAYQTHEELTQLITARIRDVPDYPQPGVVFKDITPLLADGKAFGAVIGALAEGHGPVDKVAGIEARGFILAAPVACGLARASCRSARRASCPPPRTPRIISSNTAPPR